MLTWEERYESDRELRAVETGVDGEPEEEPTVVESLSRFGRVLQSLRKLAEGQFAREQARQPEPELLPRRRMRG